MNMVRQVPMRIHDGWAYLKNVFLPYCSGCLLIIYIVVNMLYGLQRLREQAYNWVAKGQRLHITGKILYGEVS